MLWSVFFQNKDLLLFLLLFIISKQRFIIVFVIIYYFKQRFIISYDAKSESYEEKYKEWWRSWDLKKAERKKGIRMIGRIIGNMIQIKRKKV